MPTFQQQEYNLSLTACRQEVVPTSKLWMRHSLRIKKQTLEKMNLVGRKFTIHFEEYRKRFPFSFWWRKEGRVKKLEIVFFSLVSEYETTSYNRKLSKNSSTVWKPALPTSFPSNYSTSDKYEAAKKNTK